MELDDDTLFGMPLFGYLALSPESELARLAQWGKLVLHSDPLDPRLEDADVLAAADWYKVADGVRRGAFPPDAFEACIGLAGVRTPRWDENLESASDCAWLLAARTRKPTTVVSALARSAHATYPPVMDSWGKFKDRPTDSTNDHPAPPAPWLELVDRVVPLGLGGVTRERLKDDRPVVWHNRHVSPVWSALHYAFDAFGGSVLAVEQLAALSDREPARPSVAWLAEAALRMARSRERADEVARRLDGLLASGALGRNAVALAAPDDHRDALAADSLGDAFLHMGARPRVTRPLMKDRADPLERAEKEQLRRNAQAGSELARAVLVFSDYIEDDAVETGWENESRGPLGQIFDVPDEVSAALDDGIDTTITIFRVLYGLECLARAVPRLEAWLASIAG